MVYLRVRGRGCDAMWWSVAAPNVPLLLLTCDTSRMVFVDHNAARILKFLNSGTNEGTAP